jgi:hypothetical protein
VAATSFFGGAFLGGEFFNAPKADTSPPHLTWGSFNCLSAHFRGRVPKRVCEIIDDVITPVAALPQIAIENGKADAYYQKIAAQQLRRREIALRAELKAQGIAWRKLYLEAMIEIMRQQDEEIGIALLLCECS